MTGISRTLVPVPIGHDLPSIRVGSDATPSPMREAVLSGRWNPGLFPVGGLWSWTRSATMRNIFLAHLGIHNGQSVCALFGHMQSEIS